MSAIDDDFANPPARETGLRIYDNRTMRLREKRELLEEAALARAHLRNSETLVALESAAIEFARVAEERPTKRLHRKKERR